MGNRFRENLACEQLNVIASRVAAGFPVCPLRARVIPTCKSKHSDHYEHSGREKKGYHNRVTQPAGLEPTI
jgi:hypothetical protein